MRRPRSGVYRVKSAIIDFALKRPLAQAKSGFATKATCILNGDRFVCAVEIFSRHAMWSMWACANYCYSNLISVAASPGSAHV